MRNKLSNLMWGLFLILIGLGFAGNIIFHWDFNFWSDGWWTLFIIIPCFISMIQSKFNPAPTVGFIIGVLWFVSYYVDFNYDIFDIIWLGIAAIIIVTGLKIMFRGTVHKSNFNYDNTVHTEGQQTYSKPGQHEYSAIFSSNRINLNNEVFNGTNLSAVFGAIVLDLRDAVIQHDVEITATAVFGGIDIYVPRGVKVKINNVPIFGGVSNKTASYQDPSAPTIYLNSTCMFGGIDIK